MKDIHVLPSYNLGYNFIPAEFLPKGKDEYYFRNQQNPKPEGYWRNLRSDEIEILVKNANSSDSWDNILVHDPFNPKLIKNSEFFGLVRIGKLENVFLEHHDMQIQAGITKSRIISCDIGDNCCVHNVSYLAHYILEDTVILLNIDEMHTTGYAKFGNGIIKEGEEEEVRIWIDLINEAGVRKVLPFDGMIPADAYIWARYREDNLLQKRLKVMTESQFSKKRGEYGTVGSACVIKNTRIIKDVKFGPCCYVKGANKLKNLTINSREEEATQIGEGVEIVNGIIGYGCRIFYGCKAVRFIMGDNTALKYGARLIHSFLGDNSTVSCCEILNNLIFPGHEQHHNNSFLTASLIMGQSNIAAGATIGSNHNSRSNDGEIIAGRGFWPGLCITLKHNCKFASYTLLAKGDYPAELNVPLPFSLVANDYSGTILHIIPAYWWLYNLYATARNSWKYRHRDARISKVQNIVFDFLAPDTVEEIIVGMSLLEEWTGKALVKRVSQDASPAKTGKSSAKIGREALEKALQGKDNSLPEELTVLGENIEKSSREVRILKVAAAYRAYRDMLLYYCGNTIMEHLENNGEASFSKLMARTSPPGISSWINAGGQLIPEKKLAALLKAIKEEKITTWKEVHIEYDKLMQAYEHDKTMHAAAVLKKVTGKTCFNREDYENFLDGLVDIQQYVCDQVYLSRKKDFDNPFRQCTFSGPEEIEATIGTIEDNSFIVQIRKETKEFHNRIKKLRHRF